MDYVAALTQIKNHLKVRYAAKEFDGEEMAAKMARYRKLRKAAHVVLENRVRRATIKRKADKARRFFNGKVVAIDCEFTDDLLYEVGISTFENNMIDTTTYVVTEHSQRLERKAEFGDTVVLPVEEIRQIAQDAYNGASLVVFHDFRKDISLLKIDSTRNYFFDTAHFSSLVVKGDTPSLRELLTRYAIPTTGLHQAGNDSRKTLELAKEILQIGSDFKMRNLKIGR